MINHIDSHVVMCMNYVAFIQHYTYMDDCTFIIIKKSKSPVWASFIRLIISPCVACCDASRRMFLPRHFKYHLCKT
jgi:hypothetical protein